MKSYCRHCKKPIEKSTIEGWFHTGKGWRGCYNEAHDGSFFSPNQTKAEPPTRKDILNKIKQFIDGEKA